MKRPSSLILSDILGFWLLAGCATRNSSHIPSASNPVPTNAPAKSISMNLPEKDKPFGKYNAAIIEAITKKWDDILDRQKFKVDRSGKVVMRFHLHQDGTVSNVKAVENSAGYVLGYLCSRAINDAVPFAPWPPDMVRMLNRDYQEITFTFYYK